MFKVNEHENKNCNIDNIKIPGHSSECIVTLCMAILCLLLDIDVFINIVNII